MGIRLGGKFKVECKDSLGNLKWVEDFLNMVPAEGRAAILNILFGRVSQVNPWYVGLKGTGTIADADSLSSHSGWSEFTSYSGSRKEYVDADPYLSVMSNSANKASFAISGSGTIAGAFLASASSGTSGYLLCVANFASSRAVISGDTLEVTYEFGAADDGV